MLSSLIRVVSARQLNKGSENVFIENMETYPLISSVALFNLEHWYVAYLLFWCRLNIKTFHQKTDLSSDQHLVASANTYIHE